MFHRVLRLTAMLGIVLTAVLARTILASADGIESQAGSADASVGNGQVTVGASYGGDSGGSTGRAGSDVSCWYEWITGDAATILGESSPASGGWVLPHCTDAQGNVLATTLVWESPAQLRAVQSIASLGQQAIAKLPLPSSFIRTAPSPTTMQIVGATTWLWLDPTVWHTYTATATAGPVAATATAMPYRVVWNMGDGHTVTCTGPGTPYDSSRSDDAQTSQCIYAWPRSSAGQPTGAFTVTATVFWHVTWVAVGAAGGGDLGVVAGPTAQTTVRVGEAQAVNSGSN